MDATAATHFLTHVPQAGTAFVPLDPAGDGRFVCPATGMVGRSISTLLMRMEVRNRHLAEAQSFAARQLPLNLR